MNKQLQLLIPLGSIERGPPLKTLSLQELIALIKPITITYMQI